MAVTSSLLRLPPCSVLSAEISTRRRKFATVRCAQIQAEPNAQGEKRKYKDSFTDLVVINGCLQAFGRVAGWQSPRSWDEGMVEISHALARNRNAAEQQVAVLQGWNYTRGQVFMASIWGSKMERVKRISQLKLRTLTTPKGLLRKNYETDESAVQGFPKVPNWFRKLFPNSDWGAQLIAAHHASWLVGPCEVTIKDKTLESGVQIEKCRYLETSGCAGLV